jgi:hypothetical protein
MAQPVVHFEVVGKDYVTTSPSSSGGVLRYLRQSLWRSLRRTSMGSWSSSLLTMGQASAVESVVDRDMRATPCSMSVFQMSELRCSVLKTSAVHESWVPSRHPMDSSSVISRTLKAP